VLQRAFSRKGGGGGTVADFWEYSCAVDMDYRTSRSVPAFRGLPKLF
jgi:hypothetical protein